MEENGTFDLLPKKEVIKLRLEIEKLEKYLGGIQNMKKLPAALFIVDPRKERIAVSEAKKLNIPIVAIVDTNGDPENIDYPIAANDDAVKSIKVIMDTFLEAIKDALEVYGKHAAEERAKAEAAKAEKAKADAAAPKKRPAAKGGAKRPATRRAPKKADAEGAADDKKAAKKKAAPAAEAAAPAAEEAK